MRRFIGGYFHQHDISKMESGEDEDFQISLLGLEPMSFADDRQLPLFPSMETPPESKAVFEAAQFRRMFKETRKVRSLKIERFGTLDVARKGLKLQFMGLYQPIPDGLQCSFVMYLELWSSQISYMRDPTDGNTLLEFAITSMRTGQRTAMLERKDDAKMRRKSKRSVLICNKVFDLACQSLPDKPSTLCGTKESATLFGLKDPQMRDFVLRWYEGLPWA
ncbi:hypothetical protein BASA81_018350 [Batrachochytrium salamandrivorans]|nr:hypothetical protein BASA81_018350 [Batrachochytrium salamandrivorans]